MIFHSIDIVSSDTYQLLTIKNNKKVLNEMEHLFGTNSDFQLQFHTKTKTLSVNHNFPDKWLVLPTVSGSTLKSLIRWYFEYHRQGIVQDINWGSSSLPSTPALLHVEIDTQQVTMSLYQNGVAYRYEGYGVQYKAFDTDARQPFIDFLRFFSKKDKKNNKLIISAKDIYASCRSAYKTFELKGADEKAIHFYLLLWIKDLWGYLNLSGFIGRGKESILRVISCIVIIKKVAEYLSGVGANYNAEYRKKVTYSRCIIVSIYTMSPLYVMGSVYPRILFSHEYTANLINVNSYDGIAQTLMTIYYIVFTILAARKAIPENNVEANNLQDSNTDTTSTSSTHNSSVESNSANHNDNSNTTTSSNRITEELSKSSTTRIGTPPNQNSEDTIVIEEKETHLNTSNNNINGLRNRKTRKSNLNNNNNNSNGNIDIPPSSRSFTKDALSPEMKKMQTQMDHLLNKVSSSTAALDNAGDAMRRMQSKIEALEKEIAIARSEKKELQLMHKQGMASVEKQQSILENQIMKHQVEMNEQKALFESRDQLLQRKESEAEVHLKYVEQRGNELTKLISYARELFNNLNHAEQQLRTEEQRLSMKESGQEEVAGNKNKDDSNSNHSDIGAVFDTIYTNNINDGDDELKNEQQVQSIKIQLSKLREMAKILQKSLLAEEAEKDVGGSVFEGAGLGDNMENQNNTSSIVNAIDSAMQIEATLDSQAFDHIANIDMNNVDQVKDQLVRLKELAMNLNKEEDASGSIIRPQQLFPNDKASVEKSNALSSKNNKVVAPAKESKAAMKHSNDSTPMQGDIVKTTQKEMFPMKMPMGREFHKDPVKRQQSLKEHMNKLKMYAQEKYKWDQAQQ